MRNNKRTLSKEKKDTYIDIALGCKNIAKQFNQLADIYDEAVSLIKYCKESLSLQIYRQYML